MFLKDKYPTSVLFDNTEQILQHPDGVKYIQHLQDLAKEMPDKKFLFASNENSVPSIMLTRSSGS